MLKIAFCVTISSILHGMPIYRFEFQLVCHFYLSRASGKWVIPKTVVSRPCILPVNLSFFAQHSVFIYSPVGRFWRFLSCCEPTFGDRSKFSGRLNGRCKSLFSPFIILSRSNSICNQKKKRNYMIKTAASRTPDKMGYLVIIMEYRISSVIRQSCFLPKQSQKSRSIL